jgi:antitoxin PrlF
VGKESKNATIFSQSTTYGLESLVTVDERGQMVLPKEVRDRAGILPGDKLALITWGSEAETHCISLVKVKHLTGMIKGILGPLAEDILKTNESDLS